MDGGLWPQPRKPRHHQSRGRSKYLATLGWTHGRSTRERGSSLLRPQVATPQAAGGVGGKGDGTFRPCLLPPLPAPPPGGNALETLEPGSCEDSDRAGGRVPGRSVSTEQASQQGRSCARGRGHAHQDRTGGRGERYNTARTAPASRTHASK